MWWVGYFESIQPPVLPWFFHRDYALDLVGGMRRIQGTRRRLEPKDRVDAETRQPSRSAVDMRPVKSADRSAPSAPRHETTKAPALTPRDTEVDLADCIDLIVSESHPDKSVLNLLTGLLPVLDAMKSDDIQPVEWPSVTRASSTSTKRVGVSSAVSSAFEGPEREGLRRRAGEDFAIKSLAHRSIHVFALQ